MTLLIGTKKMELTSKEHLISLLDEVASKPNEEIWIGGHGESSLCTLMNASKVFFMYLRFPGDSGFRSNNSAGDVNQLQEFTLSNGQIDEYPESWLLEKNKMKEVILTYYDSGKMDSSVEWIED